MVYARLVIPSAISLFLSAPCLSWAWVTPQTITQPKKYHRTSSPVFSQWMKQNDNDKDDIYKHDTSTTSAIPIKRRNALSCFLTTSFTTIAATTATTSLAPAQTNSIANAAPPIAIIAEELGYFPVTNRYGDTIYIPANVKRSSSTQSIQLASYLKESGARMFGAYWCPHCQNQKETFGKEAWTKIPYVECSTKGYGYDATKVWKKGIDGFPTWVFPITTTTATRNNKKGNNNNNDDDDDATKSNILKSISYSIQKDDRGQKCYVVSGELPLIAIATISGFDGEFDASIEEVNVPRQVSCP